MSNSSEAAIEALGGSIGACIAMTVTYPLAMISTWQALDNKTGDVEDQQMEELKLKLKYVPSPLKELYLVSKLCESELKE